MLVQWTLVMGWLTVFGLLGGHRYSLHFYCDSPLTPFAFSVIIVGLWRMLSTICQGWGNVQSSNNASVLCSVKWWKRLVITGIIKPVRGSSMDGFVYCLLLWQHHKLLGIHFLSPGLRLQKIIASISVCAYLTAQGSVHKLNLASGMSLNCSGNMFNVHYGWIFLFKKTKKKTKKQQEQPLVTKTTVQI